MPVQRDQAVLLRRFAFGESSLVVQALTRHHGRVHLMAKGAYRPKSRYSGVLDLFDTLELEWRSSPRSQLGTLAEAWIAVRRKTLAQELARYRAALSMLELCELGTREGHPEPQLFELVVGALDRLVAGRADPDLELVAFDLRFLQNLGLAPALEHCAACGGPAPALASAPRRAAFSAAAGGRLCGRCAAENRAARRRVGTLPVEVLSVARTLLEAPAETLDKVRLDPGQSGRVREFTDRFLEYHLESRPRTRRPRGASATLSPTPLDSPCP